VTATGWKHVTEKHTLKYYCHRTRTFTSFWVGLGQGLDVSKLGGTAASYEI